jgi:hypothetical protein
MPAQHAGARIQFSLVMMGVCWLTGTGSAQDRKVADQAEAAAHWDTAYAPER